MVAHSEVLIPDSAQVVAPPPFISFGSLGVALLPHYLWLPLRLFPELWIGHASGWPILSTGLLIFFWAVRTMIKAGEDVRVEKPTNAIVSHGPFAYSRNPIYVAMVFGFVGICLVLNTYWPLIFLPVVLLIMHYGVIKREERYLERLFGEEYLHYQSSVRRWL